MGSLPESKPLRFALLIALGLFVVSRLLTLTVFPIFNDEAIYLQYSQAIHADWHQNKFISMDNHRGDWKPPLQYWLAAPFIKLGNDPLLIGRLTVGAVSLLGFFGFYLFARELFGTREGVISAWLYVLCPTTLLYNNQFIAEPFLFSVAPFVYWSVLKAMRADQGRWRWMIGALLFASALLLFKQSGLLLLGTSLFLAATNGSASRQQKFGIVAGVIFGAVLIVSSLLPSELNARRDTFHNHLLLSFPELLRFPSATWLTNLSMVAEYFTSYYSWFVVLFFAVFLWIAIRDRKMNELALALMCLTAGMTIMLLLRQPNEYLFNAAVIATLLPLLARTATAIWALPKNGALRLVRTGLNVFALMTVAYWSYQDILMSVSPGRFFERSTPWATENYLKRWSNGFGIKEVVALLKKEKRPGIILADPQWGNPRAALEVYQDRFPNLRIVPFRRGMLKADALEDFRKEANAAGPARFAIFSASTEPPRPEWQAIIEREMCIERSEVRVYSSQTPIVICRF